jgi:hypothetical protein
MSGSPNNCVQATPGSAVGEFLRRSSGAPEDDEGQDDDGVESEGRQRMSSREHLPALRQPG